jgi:hypothetical protein
VSGAETNERALLLLLLLLLMAQSILVRAATNEL